MKNWGTGFLLFIGAVAVLYSVAVLGYVASSPDLRLRCLLSDNDRDPTDQPHGVVIRSNTGMEYKGAKPEPGDLLVRLGKKSNQIRTFRDFSRHLFNLRNEPLPTGALVYGGTDPSEDPNSPWQVEDPAGQRFVAVEFIDMDGDGGKHTSYLRVQPLPLGEVLLSVVWFALQLGVLVFGAVAYWNRPYDRTARLFLVMCIVTLGAYVGGYHWWIVSGRLWLKLPFSICALLVPAVALHFFLIFPRPKLFVSRFPRTFLAAIYAIPVTAAAAITALYVHLERLAVEPGERAIVESLQWHSLLRQGVYIYFGIAAVYFVLSLIAARHSLARTRNPLELGQLRWIWNAGLVAAVCIGYTIYLAINDSVAFAVGGGRLPMFLASLSFMFAYSVGIVRYRLMLVDQIVGKGVLYYVISGAAAVLFGLLVSLGSLSPQILNIAISQQQALTVALVMTVAVILLLWLRDVLQQAIDRQFFREKYQLDKALERVNRAIGHLADPQMLAEMMLGSCRDVLDVDHAALYLRMSAQGSFQLAAADGAPFTPLQITPEGDFIDLVRKNGSLQRVTPGSRSELSVPQSRLREMRADLVFTLETGNEVVGLVFLGKKKNSSTFTAEDLTFLNALGQITIVALHSLKVDREVAGLNEDLRLKLDKINEQKRQIALLQSELTSTQVVTNSADADRPEEDFHRNLIKGNSPAIRSVMETVRKVARTDASVLIGGESGTGKELLAQILHENSPRRTGPLIRVHCAALAPGILESELFGHVKGAFTGAHRDRQGRFQMADEGTLFLDEIGDISLETQVKLLRVLQERRFEPVGGSQTISVNVRLITATHRNLEQFIAEGRFREDLYYRLNVVHLALPPLRERRDDICELAIHFLNRAAERAGKRIGYIDDDALSALEHYAWPGNVRELENVIERAVVFSEEGRITIDHLPVQVATGRVEPPVFSGERVRHGAVAPAGLLEGPTRPRGSNAGGWAATALSANNDEDERNELVLALEQSDGNKAEAARRLGLPRSTYYSKLKKYGIG
jgi:transcriptional regulator with GAF, ATPase, and Fis domain